MGLFDMFTHEGRLKRHARRMADKDALPEDREASERWLLDEGSGQALYALLKRFDVKLTQQLVDKTEKERLYEHLVGRDPALDGPLDQWVKAARQKSWPLRLIESRRGAEAAVLEVNRLLEAERGTASFEPERKKHLLVWLADHRHPSILDSAAPFLDDFDEEVRYAAAEALIAQDDDAARPALAAVLARADEESNRLKHRIATVFARRGWSVDAPDAVAAALPGGFVVQGDRLVATAG